MSEVKKALAALASKLHAKDPYFSLGTDQISSDITDSVSTGCTPLDVVLSSPSNPKGGLPFGRVIEIFGGESEGKTTLGESIIAMNCKRQGITILILSEGSIDKKRLELEGVDLGLVVTKEVAFVEEGFETIDSFLKELPKELAGTPVLCIWDTVSQCSFRDGTGGMQDASRIMHAMKRKYSSVFSRAGLGMVFIAQVFDSIGSWGGGHVSSDFGRAIRFWASVRLDMKKGAWIDGSMGREGLWAKVSLFKSKISVPCKLVNVAIRFKTGVDNDLSMWTFLKDTERLPPGVDRIFWVQGSWHKCLSPSGGEVSFRFEDLYDVMNTDYKIGERDPTKEEVKVREKANAAEPNSKKHVLLDAKVPIMQKMRDFVVESCWKLKDW